MSAINYDLTKIRAIVFDVDGVLSPSVIPLSETGIPMRMVNIKDGYAIQLAVKQGLKLAVITGGNTLSVRVRFEALGIKDIFMGAAHKLPVLEEWMQENGLQKEEVAYMGDDIPDLRPLRYVGLSCCPADAASEVKSTCTYISRFTGGYGCARDLLQQVLRSQGKWMNDADAFGW